MKPYVTLVLLACSSRGPTLVDTWPPDAGPPMLSLADQQAILAAHNAVRANAMPVPSPALPMFTWDATVAAHAAEWASRCDWMHSMGSGYGENLFAADQDATPQEAVAVWANESKGYDYATNHCSEICGHYTQLVWRDSVKLGCGVAECTVNSPLSTSSHWQFWVCNYDPPGNVNGQRPY